MQILSKVKLKNIYTPKLRKINESLKKNMWFQYGMAVLAASVALLNVWIFFQPQLQQIGLVLGLRDAQKPQIENLINEENLSSTPTLENTPTTAPITTFQAKPTIDPDPVINCNVAKIGIVKLKSSQCSVSFACEIGKDKWYLYSSKEKCTQDQENYAKGQINNAPYIPPANSTSGTSTVSCTVNYPCTNSTYTYQLDPDYCKTVQQQAISMCNTFSSGSSSAPSTTSQVDQQAQIEQHNNQVRQCQSNVVNKYQGIMQGCTQYGASSAYDACVQINSSNRQKEYDSCGSLI